MKRIFIILCLTLFIISVAAVSAADENQTIINDESDILTVSQTDEVLGADDGTFTALQNKISRAADGATINLENDYIHDSRFSDDGISITRDLTINGNGHKIDANGASRIFFISDAKVILNNVELINGTSDLGGAISNSEGDITLNDCNIRDNFASFGGAICSVLGSVHLSGCYFNNNIAASGGALYTHECDEVSFYDCDFNKNLAYYNGGALYSYGCEDVKIDECRFFEDCANWGGGIYSEQSIIALENSAFTNAYAIMGGGAIASNESGINIKSCNFKNDTCKNTGGTIYNFRSSLYIDDSEFRQGGSIGKGGVIGNLESNLTVLSSVFYDNFGTEGGVIYNIYGNVRIEDNTFYMSLAHQFAVMQGDLLDSLSIKNNYFINSTSNTANWNPAIQIMTRSTDITESGNHFEDAYHVFLELAGYYNGNKFTLKSNEINYIMSSTGKYYENWDTSASSSDTSSIAELSISDYYNPGISTIYGDYADEMRIAYDLKTYSSNLKDLTMTIKIYNDGGYLIEEESFVPEESEGDYCPDLNFKDLLIVVTKYYIPNYLGNNVVSLINTTPSDLDYLPSRYSSKDYGYLTPVKDQGEGGNCWAFAGIATLEACIKKITNITYDFSEENVKNNMAAFSTIGFDMEPNEGGYDFMVMGYLTSGLGPVLEEYDKYNPVSVLSNAFKSSFHVDNILFLPPRQNGLYDDIYKKAIMDYGAIAISLNLTDLYKENAYHSVSLVGWDDNYNNYDLYGNYAKGAWIFKNSWGEDWGDEGYGYISYDVEFLNDVVDYAHAYTFIFNKEDNYTQYYNFDDYPGVSDYIYNDGIIFADMVVSIPTGRTFYLSAISTYFKIPTSYVLRILDVENNIILTQSGYSEAGYYTIPLEKTVPMSLSEVYQILFAYANSDGNYLPICQIDDLTASNIMSNDGYYRCYASFDGGQTLNDLYELEDYHEFLYTGTRANTCQVACIHLKGTYGDCYPINLDIDEFEYVDLGEDTYINVELSDSGSILTNNLDTMTMIENSLVTLNIDGKDYYALIHDGKASLKIRFDEQGTHRLKAQYKNNLFESNVVEISFSSMQTDTQTSITSSQKANTVTLTAVVDSPTASGQMIFNINGEDYPAEVVNGVATLSLRNLDSGTYTAEAKYQGDGKNKLSTSSRISFSIEEADFTVTAPDLVKYFKGPERFVVTVKNKDNTPITNAEVKIYLNGQTYTKTTDSNGQTSMGINLNSGTYPVSCEYNEYEVDSKIIVMATVSGSDITKIYKNATQYYAKFIDTQGNPIRNRDVIFNINGVFYTRTTDGNGVARMNINLNPGTYVITAENPETTEKYTNTITVLPSIVENYDLTKYYKNASRYTLRILGDDGKPVGEGVVVKLNINGVFYERKTDTSGYMRMNINLEPGTYVITAEYNGLMASNTIKVISVIETWNLKMTYKDGSKFEARILDGQGRPYAGQTVTFNINGVFYEKITDGAGIARLTINLMAGEYIITSSFNGLNAANKVTISS